MLYSLSCKIGVSYSQNNFAYFRSDGVSLPKTIPKNLNLSCETETFGIVMKEKNLSCYQINMVFYPIALRKAKIVYNFGLSECNRVKGFADKCF